MRRAQNGLTPLIARTFTASKIQSFSELVDAIRAKPEKYSPEAAELVAEYWERSGRAIKGYRDISQHHAVVASDVRLFYGEGIPVLLHVLLPSNPHEKSLYKLSYGEPVVMAVPFCRDAFIDLVAFSLAMSRVLRVRLGPAATVTMRHTFKAPVHLNSLLGFHEPLPDDLDTFLWELREDAESNSGKYFEPLHPPEPA